MNNKNSLKKGMSKGNSMQNFQQNRILSLQSHVVFGHVGNRAVTFPLERLGFDVLPMNTVQFSSHTGYAGWQGQKFNGADLQSIFNGLSEIRLEKNRTLLSTITACLSGYIGQAEICEVWQGIIQKCRGENDQLLYICDPVFGDVGTGLFVPSQVQEEIQKRLLPEADFVTPNLFELSVLCATPLKNETEIIKAARSLCQGRLQAVLVTSVCLEEEDPEEMSMMLVCRDRAFRIFTPKLRLSPIPNGAGDLTAGLFLGYYLRSKSVRQALAETAAVVFSVLKKNQEGGARDLQILSVQDLYPDPPKLFHVKQIL